MTNKLFSTLKQTTKEFHPAVGQHMTESWSEYSMVTVTWKSGKVTNHLQRVEFTKCGNITIEDPWKRSQYGVEDSKRVAESFGISWPGGAQ